MKTLIAAISLLAPSLQEGAPPACVQPIEIEHATLFALPPVLDALAEQCRASLPAGAYLLTGGSDLSKRLAADRGAHWDGARGALVRLAGDAKAGMLSADTASGFLRDMIRLEGGKMLDSETCGAVDRGLALLAPLPPENLAGLVTLALEQGLKADARKAASKADPKKPKPAPRPIVCPAAPPS